MTVRVFRRSVGGGPSLTSYEFTAPDHDFGHNAGQLVMELP